MQKSEVQIDSAVRVYDGEWFNEGRVTEIEGDTITVDFLDWIQQYRRDELSIAYIFFAEIWLASPHAGTTIKAFR